MWRVLACGFVAACAEATHGGTNGTVDAPPAHADAPKQIDAPMATCSTSATCQTAMDLGTVSGDTGSQMVMASGYQAAWVHVRVTENDNSPIGTKLTMTAQLTSPAAGNFDMAVYVNTGNDVLECATPTGTPTSSGTTDSQRLSWGEGTVANGNDDSRTVSIEVKPPATCAPGQMWQLVITGDT